MFMCSVCISGRKSDFLLCTICAVCGSQKQIAIFALYDIVILRYVIPIVCRKIKM